MSEETKEIIENLENCKIIQTRKGFVNRLSKHLEKHGWFYGAVVQLLGTAAMTMLGA